MRYFSLYLYHFVFFAADAFSVFLSKYYSEIGMSASRIGWLTSLPTFVTFLCMPFMSTLPDRVGKKRNLLAAEVFLMACSSLAAWRLRAFVPLLFAVIGFGIFFCTTLPILTTIALEYCSERGKLYGPVRMMGTIGHGTGVLMVSWLMSRSLSNLYLWMGLMLLLSCSLSFLLPDVRGQQRNQKKNKISVIRFFRDRHVLILFVVLLCSAVTTQFYATFFSKYLGDMGMDNSTISLITFLTVLPEIPFLFFFDRIAKKTNVWNFLLIGLILTGLRWIALSFSSSSLPVILIQLIAFSTMGCFEMVPALYLSRRVAPEQRGTAQTMLAVTNFGLSKIIGSLLGGYLSELTAVSNIFLGNGILLLVGCVVLWKPTRRLIAEEAADR